MIWAHRNTIIWIVIIAVSATICALRFDMTTDIAEFLPEPESRKQAQITREIATGDLSRRMIVTAKTSSDADAARVSRVIEAAILANETLSEHLESVSAGPAEGTDQAIWEIYHPRRFGFVGSTVDEARQAASDESLARSATNLLRTLEQPLSALITRVAPGDPLLIIPGLFERFGASQAGSIRLVDNRFVSAEGHYAVLFLKTASPAFDTDSQQLLLDELTNEFERLRSEDDALIEIEMSGVNRFAVASKTVIERDIRRITIVSVVALSIMLLLLFRSLRIVLLTTLPVATGVLVGLATTLCVYGRVHGITLAFGAALIGVAVDYVVHLYCHHIVVDSEAGPQHAVRKIWPALLMGAVTTMTGFGALAFSAFSGLQEVAVFALAGLFAALLTTRFLIPEWIGAEVRPVAFRSWLVDALHRQYKAMSRRKLPGYLLLAIAVITTAAFAPQIEWSSNLVEMGELDPELIAEEEAVRARVSRFEQTRFIVARGPTEEEALRANDRVADTLRAGNYARQFSSIQALLPSAERQEQVASAFLDSDELTSRFVDAFEAAGFRDGAFAPFLDAINSAQRDPVSYSMLAESDLSTIVDTYRLSLDEDVGFITFLHDVANPDDLERAIGNLDGATFLDQTTMLREAGQRYQRRTVELLGVGMLSILALLFLRYRNPRKVAASVLPSVLAVGVTLAVLTFFGEPVDLVVLTALLMIVSMGVDYGVFLVDGKSRSETDVAAAMLSILVAGLSTLLGFGLLALSDYPILFRIGLTAAIGISAAMILAPISLTILGENDR